jgi:hypothetical protein
MGEPDHGRRTNRGGSMVVGSSARPDGEDRDHTRQPDSSREQLAHLSEPPWKVVLGI